MPSVGLMMIVKDEAHVVRTCLDSVRPFIDWWVVADTGSTDGTQDVVREALSELPGELVERPWVNFGHNRQEVLDLARSSPHRAPGDHALWIDADEQLRDVPAERPELSAAGHTVRVGYAGTRYHRLAIIALDQPWRWTGPVHEYLDLPGAATTHLDAPSIHVEHTGARSLDASTYSKDAALIEEALQDDPGNPRLQFYLAQSWKDAGELGPALDAYRLRIANQDGWDQETWFALLQVGVVLERLGAPPSEVVDAYLAAYSRQPARAEPLVELARFERGRQRYESALLFARPATRIPQPHASALFVDTSCYTWRAWDEVAISSYWTGRYADGALAAAKALQYRPDDDRLRANLAWCQDKLTAE